MKNKQKIIALTILIGLCFIPLVSATSYTDARYDVWNFDLESYGDGVCDIDTIIVSNEGVQIRFHNHIIPQLGNGSFGIFAFVHVYNDSASVNFMLAFAYLDENMYTMESGVGLIENDTLVDSGLVDAMLFGDSIFASFPFALYEGFQVEGIEVIVSLVQVEEEFEMEFTMLEMDWFPNIAPGELVIFEMFEHFEGFDPSQIEELFGDFDEIPAPETSSSIIDDFFNADNWWLWVIIAVLIVALIIMTPMLARKPKQMTTQELKYQKKVKK